MGKINNIVLLVIMLPLIICGCSNSNSNDQICKEFKTQLNSYDDANCFIDNYYKDKDDEVKKIYLPIVEKLIRNKHNLVISKISKTDNNVSLINSKKDIDNIYIIKYGLFGKIIAKSKDKKIQFLVPIKKGKLIIGWI